VAITGDEELAALLEEVTRYPLSGLEPESERAAETAAAGIITALMRMRSPEGEELSMFVTVATFGTVAEVTTSELSIELAYPADAATAEVLRKLPHR
jgi:acetamidase/formamidase